MMRRFYVNFLTYIIGVIKLRKMKCEIWEMYTNFGLEILREDIIWMALTKSLKFVLK